MLAVKLSILALVAALWFEAARVLRRNWKQYRCLHLHPELVELDGKVSRFRCLDCGYDGLEAIG